MARKLPPDKKKRNLLILGLQKAINAKFSDSDWKELGYRTGADDWIERHPRLIRSLHWNDPDYAGHILDAIEYILELDPANLDAFIENPLISEWIGQHDPSVLAFIGGAKQPAVVLPPLAVTSDALERALRDAEVLINSAGPSSAVDRVHTALHAFMIAACDAAAITYNPDPSITELFKVLRQHHPALQNVGPQSAQVLQILQGFASIVHVVNELRNRASGAHPNPHVLGPDEAQLVVNGTRTLFAYLNAKVS